jgi:DNA invertase Pin-like site-specific DNA recombinase
LTEDGWKGTCDDIPVTVQAASFEQAKSDMELLMFQIIGAMAEFERALIQERVRAGLRNAQAKGKQLGRTRVVVDASRIADRAQGRSWAGVEAETGISKGTAQRAVASLPKICS